MNASESQLHFTNMTLLAVDGRNTTYHVEMAHKALIFSKKNIQFKHIKLLTTKRPRHSLSDIEYHQIAPINTHLDYSKFIFSELINYVDTTHVLLVQADGFITNARAWQPQFMAYDYIGAPWPQTTTQRLGADYATYDLSESGRVGNGGFSLRSKRLLEACASINYHLFGNLPEDFVICRLLRQHFLAQGLSFAPLELAAQFALELPISEAPFNLDATFGFHGRHFKPEHLLMSLEA